jgi:hypothetical protein
LVAVDVVALPIVATRNLTLGAIGLAIVGNVAHLATEVLRRFAKEAFFQPLNLLTIERTTKFFLLVESLKKVVTILTVASFSVFPLRSKFLRPLL